MSTAKSLAIAVGITGLGAVLGTGFGLLYGMYFKKDNTEHEISKVNATDIGYGIAVGSGIGLVAGTVTGIVYLPTKDDARLKEMADERARDQVEMVQNPMRRGIRWASDRSLENIRTISARNLREREGGGRKATYDRR